MTIESITQHRIEPVRHAGWKHEPLTLRTQLLRSVAVLVLLACCFWPGVWAGQQMLLHIVLMTVLAPLLAQLWHSYGAFSHGAFGHDALPAQTCAAHLWLATMLQSAVFLFWHTPVGMTLGMHTEGGEVLLQGSLLMSALWFWSQLMRLEQRAACHGIAALLVTGKLFCLVALLLVFAPRTLYHGMTLADQQLAGLIMVTLCPLCYVATALWLCWRWLQSVEQRADGATA